MSFKRLQGQDRAIEFLRRSAANKRIAHAYIFLGPRGVGKFTTALEFAKLLNCEKVLAAGEPCDECASCKKIAGSNHPDIFVMRSEKDGSSIKIDRVRDLIKDIGLKPYEGKKKVYIIDGADLMTQEASNALLKTLEEPPSDAVMILITDNLNALFETIVSRSQVVRFFSLPIETVCQILKKDHEIDPVEAHLLSHLSSGRLGEALVFHKSDFFDRRTPVIDRLVRRSLFEDELDSKGKADLRAYLDIMLSWYRDVLITKAGSDERLLMNVDRKDEIVDEARGTTFELLDRAICHIIETGSQLDQNANQKLAMGVLALRLQEK